ncbi:dihydrodipicolinate synthase family protein [Oceaniglobus trochenteri]|uniref:dihydrodipicolinate synthase family protein n=1 Tax=Oceaniglobus trochenteri TaxID=2763260 RepID=UPI001D000537|nr:dihydrodipicolinate synthase family protein [Oceaniglobus trochenteri]
MTRFRGTFTVMITPFGHDGALDLGRLAAFTDWQVREGIHGLIPLGSTGEFLSMTDDEHRAAAACVVDTVAGRVPVLIGAGAERTEDCMDRARMARDVGADGTMIIPPFYSTPTEPELIRHYERIAAATDLPMMIYNNPATANVDLTPPLVARLSEIEHVDYIKESTMDPTRIRDILDLSDGRMCVFGGIMGYESFCSGADGWVAVPSNLLPADCARLYDLTMAGKHTEARALYAQILPVIRLVGGHRYVSATKSALNLMDHPVGDPRAPRLPTPAGEMEALRRALEDAGVRLNDAA